MDSISLGITTHEESISEGLKTEICDVPLGCLASMLISEYPGMSSGLA